MTDLDAGTGPDAAHACDGAAGSDIAAGQACIQVSRTVTVSDGEGRGPLRTCSTRTAGEVAPGSDGFKTSGPAAVVTVRDQTGGPNSGAATPRTLEQLINDRPAEIVAAIWTVVGALLRVDGGRLLLDRKAGALLELLPALQDLAESAEFGGGGDGPGTLVPVSNHATPDAAGAAVGLSGRRVRELCQAGRVRWVRSGVRGYLVDVGDLRRHLRGAPQVPAAASTTSARAVADVVALLPTDHPIRALARRQLDHLAHQEATMPSTRTTLTV